MFFYIEEVFLNVGQLLNKLPLHNLLDERHQLLLLVLLHVDDLLQIFLFLKFIRLEGQVQNQLENVAELFGVGGFDEEDPSDPLLLFFGIVVGDDFGDGLIVPLSQVIEVFEEIGVDSLEELNEGLVFGLDVGAQNSP